MNYFAHALPFLDRPWFMAGTGVPDWLMVSDRPTRLRSKQAAPFADNPDFQVAEVAGGVLQHLRDDARFHQSRTFTESSLELTVRARDALGGDDGLRPALVGHLLVELLLDAALVADAPERLTEYYRALETVDARRVEAAVNLMALRPAQRLAEFIGLFCRQQILWNYREDSKLMVRLNQVMRRVGLDPLPDEFAALLPFARELVSERKAELMEGLPA